MEDKIRYPEIDFFIRNIIKGETGHLKKMEEYARLRHIPIVQAETAALLKVLVNIHRPQRILEAGTAIGYSSGIMAKAMSENGMIDTIEIDEETALLARDNIRELGLQNKIKVIVGDALEIMQCLYSSYDMIFLDAAKGQYNEYFAEAFRLLRPGGLLVSDNVLYKGLVAQSGPVLHKHRTITMKLREYLVELCRSDQLETAVIPIGDGLAVSVKKGEKNE